jgi:hypothetical protein
MPVSPSPTSSHARAIPMSKTAQEVTAPQLFDRETQHVASHRVRVDIAAPGIDDTDHVLGTGKHLGQRRQAQRGGVRERSGAGGVGEVSNRTHRRSAVSRLLTAARHR